jgi:hypothetical protein
MVGKGSWVNFVRKAYGLPSVGSLNRGRIQLDQDLQKHPEEHQMKANLPVETKKDSAPQTPFCGELRSRAFLMLDVIPTDASQYLDASNHCWCFHTQQVLGPDGELVAPEHCTPGRGCYRSALAPIPPTIV